MHEDKKVISDDYNGTEEKRSGRKVMRSRLVDSSPIANQKRPLLSAIRCERCPRLRVILVGFENTLAVRHTQDNCNFAVGRCYLTLDVFRNSFNARG